MGCFGLGFGLYVGLYIGLSFDDIFDCAWLCFGSGFFICCRNFLDKCSAKFWARVFWFSVFGLGAELLHLALGVGCQKYQSLLPQVFLWGLGRWWLFGC